MKVFLSTPPGKTTEKWPPLGLLYLASSLREERGDDVVVCDAFCADMDMESLVSRIIKEGPDVVGLNCSTHTFLEAVNVLEKVRAALPESVIVLGGYHATFATENILRSYESIDYIIRGEAERSLVKLLDHLEGGTDPSDVEGICYLKGEGLVERPICLVDDLDGLPFPDRRMLGDLKYGYTHAGVPLTFGKFTTISSSRGCPFRCTYCSCAAFSLNRWRPRSPENVVEELESIYSEGYESCVFVDDNFTHNPKRAERICELIRERRIRMALYCEGRVDSASKELMRAMKGAGFDVIYFGAESASSRTLEYYKKHITPEKTATAVANAKDAGMLVITSYIIGAPVERQEDVAKTIDFIRGSRPHAVQVNILDCLVGTEIWNDMCHQGLIGPEEWKTNHRIYEYRTSPFDQERLQGLVDEAYSEWLRGWWSRDGVAEFLKVLWRNNTARRVVFTNLFNPNVRAQLRDGVRPFHTKREGQEAINPPVQASLSRR
ncbi:MAG: B12-binding domain-containing radical SAM protein [Methanomassiliicoccales archaeon]|nr:B12-binding domain-containing radical SAM protein [Methanomassiliicoccales archaeon]MDD1756481.1 B12-binding domain-containing radical SAM protein [Methanomassiliicoccales archaeon]